MSAPRPRLLWPALALIGAGVALLAALVTISVPGTGPPPRVGAEIALAEDASPGWAFVTDRAGLSGVRIWLAQPAPDGAELAVRIADAALPGLALVETVAPLTAADADGAVDVRFAPLRAGSSPHVLTTTLQVQIRPRGLPAGAQITLRGSADPAADSQAAAFTPLYEARPFDALWPISRMADGRPGLLGWPPFYLLVAYGFLLLLLRTLWLATRAVAVEPPPSN